jgi:hypothetical protein
MATKITSVSLQDCDLEIIERFNLSPTALIKERLAEFRQVSSITEQLVQEKQQKIEVIMSKFQHALDFITKKGLIDEYLK